MTGTGIKIRLMDAGDFDAVVGIDERVRKARRQEYYGLKFEKLVRSREYLPASLVAENELLRQPISVWRSRDVQLSSSDGRSGALNVGLN